MNPLLLSLSQSFTLFGSCHFQSCVSKNTSVLVFSSSLCFIQLPLYAFSLSLVFLCACSVFLFAHVYFRPEFSTWEKVKTWDYYEKETISQIFLWSCIREVTQRQSKKWTHHIHKWMCKYYLVVFRSVLFWSVSHCTLWFHHQVSNLREKTAASVSN